MQAQLGAPKQTTTPVQNAGTIITPRPPSKLDAGYTPLREEFAHITQKMYTQNLALSQTNRTLSMLRSIDSLILDSSRDLRHLSDDLARIFVDTVPYPVAGILSLSRYNDDLLTLQGF